jgi:hypothetical protein
MRGAILVIHALALMAAGSPAAKAAERVATSIYKCELDGVVTFSDRPCGNEIEPHTLDQTAMNTYEAPAVAVDKQRRVAAPAKKRSPVRADRSEAKRVASCARYARRMKEIRSKMRSGYSAKEGEQLRLRQEQLREDQRAAKCS